MGGGQRWYLWVVAAAVAIALGVVVVLLLVSSDTPEVAETATSAADAAGSGDATDQPPELPNALQATTAGPDIEMTFVDRLVRGTFIVDANDAVRSNAVGGEVRFRVIPESADVSPLVRVRVFPTGAGPGSLVERIVEGDPVTITFGVDWPQEFTYQLELMDPGGIGGLVSLAAQVRAGFEQAAPQGAELTAAFSLPVASSGPKEAPIGSATVESARRDVVFEPGQRSSVQGAVVTVPGGYFAPLHVLSLNAASPDVRVEVIPATSSDASAVGQATDGALSVALPGAPFECAGPEVCRTVYWIVFFNDSGAGRSVEWWIESNGSSEGVAIEAAGAGAPFTSTAGRGEAGDRAPLRLSVRDGASEMMLAIFVGNGEITEEATGAAVVEVMGRGGTTVSAGLLSSWTELCPSSCATQYTMVLRRSLAGETTFEPGAGRPTIDWGVEVHLVTASGIAVPASVQLALSAG